MDYDMIIVGGGIMGAATAATAAGRGQKVLLLEQFEPGHQKGSSHGDGRIIRFTYPEPIYVEMAQKAYPAWHALEQKMGQKFILTSGGWDCGPAGCQALTELENNLRHYHIPYEKLTAAQSNQRFAWFHLPEGSEAIYQKDTGVLRADAAVASYWQVAQAAGATTRTHCQVAAVEPTAEGGLVVLGNGEKISGRVIVLTTAGWTNKLLNQLGHPLPLTVTQEQVGFFKPTTSLDHTWQNMPVFIDYHSELPFFGLPQIDVPGVKIGWHHAGNVINADDERFLDDNIMQTIQQFVPQRLPFLNPEPFQRLTCLYTNTPDHHFVLDHLPGYPQIVLGTGFSGHGFKFAPVVGEILTALAVGEPAPLALEMFAVGRFSAPAALHKRTGA